MNPINLATVPPHVPSSLVRDVDSYHLPGSEDDHFLAMKYLQDEMPDIFWTPHNGGHWVLTRGEDIYPMFANIELMSNERIGIPATPGSLPNLPIEADGASHAMYRKLIQPWFTPKHVDRLAREVARPLAIRLIEGFKPNGGCEFIEDFAKQLPIVVFMDLMGLPHEDAALLLPLVEGSLRSNDLNQRADYYARMGEYIARNVESRRGKFGDDIMTTVVNARFDGRPATDQEIFGYCYNLLFGGLDTVAATLGFMARFLADSPDHRRQLRNDPTLIPKAVDELLRRFGVANPGKMCAKDFVYKGVQFKKGDMVQFQSGMHGLDERQFERPLDVDFNRPTPISSVFGNGPHRCPGSYLARSELKIFLEEWLPRIPDFQVAPGQKPRGSGGAVSGINYLPLSWQV